MLARSMVPPTMRRQGEIVYPISWHLLSFFGISLHGLRTFGLVLVAGIGIGISVYLGIWGCYKLHKLYII